MLRRHLLAATSGLALPALAPGRRADAQGVAWPARGPIRLVATFPPGGFVDTMTRLIAPVLGGAVGQTVVVENRAGAAGVVGTDYVAKQPADGYTFLMTHAVVFVYAVATLPSVPFDPVGDFTHLGMLVDAPVILMVRAASPFRTLGDLLAAARTRPVRYATSGPGSQPHMMGAMLTSLAGVPQFEHAPYTGSAPGLRDLLGGHIESMFDPITTNVQALRDGSLRALAVSTARRLDALPDIPTFAEQGFPDLVQGQWIGLSAPKNLPAPIATRMMEVIPRLVANPTVLERAQALVTLPRDPTPVGADFVNVIRQELEVARTVARRFNIMGTA